MKMASVSVASFASNTLLLSCLLLLLISPAYSLTCSSQNLKNKKFDQCLDLPALKAYLHYTYDATNSSLSLAFIDPPAKPDGWVAWAINPKGQGMVGSQALLAYKSNNKAVVKTFAISSYSSITESKLAFDAWDLSAEASADGNIVIYGSIKVEGTKLNQVWQVGGDVRDGKPGMHDFKPDNMNSKGTLVLGKSKSTPRSSSAPKAAVATPPSPSSSSSSPPPPSSSSSSSAPPSEPAKGGQTIIKSNPISLFLGLLLFTAEAFVY